MNEPLQQADQRSDPMRELKFDTHCQSTVQGLRSALLELYRSVGADTSRPQEVSRQYKLNKNLTWKVSKIIGTDDAFEAVRLIPGTGGFEILLKAMSSAGAKPEDIDRVREAMRAFEEMIETHMGDRAHLELVLDSMGVGRPMEQSRKQAHRGNSGIWGVSAQTRFTTHFIAPNADDPAKLDLSMIGGLTRMQRLRHTNRWPVLQLRNYNDDGTPLETANRRVALASEPGDRPGDPWLLREFCSPNMPEIFVRTEGDTDVYEIGDGPVGKLGEFSCCFGFGMFGAFPRYADETNRVGELGSSVFMPVEQMHFDVFVHRELTEVRDTETFMTGTLGGSMIRVGSMPIPLPERFHDLGFNSMIDTPRIDRYRELVTSTMDALGHDVSDFRCLRLTIDHPPLSSNVIMRYTLPDAPA